MAGREVVDARTWVDGEPVPLGDLGHPPDGALGVDPVPTVKICSPTGDQASVLSQTIKDIGSGKVRTDKLTGLNDYGNYNPA